MEGIMDMQEVKEMLTTAFSMFDIKLLTVIATGFTIYFGYHKISKKICISYSISIGGLYDTNITNLVVSNKRDNVLAISSIFVKIGNKGRLSLVEFGKPLVIKGYETHQVDVPMYSAVYKGNERIHIEFNDELTFFVSTTSGVIIKCEIESPVTINSLKDRLQKTISKLGDVILTDKMGYVFICFIDGERKVVLIDKHGIIEGYTPFYFNKFDEITSDSFRDILIEYGYHDYFSNYSLYQIDEKPFAKEILNKSMVNNYLQKKEE